MPTSLREGGCFALVWLLAWTAGITAVDVLVSGSLYHQTRALAFASTEGTVTKSAIRTERDSDGENSHRLDIAYDYEVNGQRYTGTRYCYTEMGTNSRAWHKISAALLPGERVAVWYDPNDPNESVLHPGLTGFDLSMIWFLTPFNIIMLGGWVMLIRSQQPAFDPADPRWAETLPTGVRVRLPTVGRAGRFAACLFGITFVGIFVWGFGFGFNPPVLLAWPAYLAAFALSVIAALWFTPPVLEVNESECVLRFALDGNPIEVPFTAIRAVLVAHEKVKDSDGDVTHNYHCELFDTDEPRAAPSARVATFDDPETAERFVAWLRERVGVKV